MRHGQADWPGWSRPEEERPLSPEGREQMRRIARFFSQRSLAPGTIVSSPLIRAKETAELLGAALRIDAQVDDAAGPGFNAQNVESLVSKYSGADLVIVSHEPGLSLAVWEISGASVVMPPACIAAIELTDPATLRGRLLRLVPPIISSG